MQLRPERVQCSFHRLNWLNCVALASAVGCFSRTRNCSLVLKVAHVTGWVSCGLIHSSSTRRRRRIWFRQREKIKSSVIFMKGRVGQHQNADPSWESVKHTTACDAKRGIKISAIIWCAKIRFAWTNSYNLLHIFLLGLWSLHQDLQVVATH